MSPGAIALHLRIRVQPADREKLLAFLREAKPFYEQPGGIRMRLLQDVNDHNVFIEVFEYESMAAHTTDEKRVRDDPTMKIYLDRWRELLDGPPVAEVYAEQMIHDNAQL